MPEREKGPAPMPPTIFETEVIENSIKEKGYFVLPKGTRAMLTEVVDNEDGTDYTMNRLGLITLKSPLEVSFPMNEIVSDEPLEEAPKSTMTVNFIPTSEKFRKQVRKFGKLQNRFYSSRGIRPWEFNPWDVPDEATSGEIDALDALEDKLEDTERKLVLDVLKGREDLLRKHGLKKSEVEIVVLSVSIPAFEIEEPPQKSPWIAVPINVYSARFEEIAQAKVDKEGK